MKSALYDFLFPTHVLFVDPAPWPALTVQFQSSPIKIHKPITEQTGHPVPGSIGNEHLDIYSTIVRLELSSDAPPPGHLLYPFSLQCLAWVRVLTRQYWVGLSGSGTASARGSSLIRDPATGIAEPTNFGMFGTPIIPQILSKETWMEIELPVASGQFPRTSDLVFCNAMLALRDGNFREAIALLGIACEFELGECLQYLLAARGDPVTDLLYKRTRPEFAWKLNHFLPALSGRNFSTDEPHWCAELIQLYEARGTAAHSALRPDMLGKAPSFVLAADSFLRWTHGIRSGRGEPLGPCPLPLRATIGAAASSPP